MPKLYSFVISLSLLLVAIFNPKKSIALVNIPAGPLLPACYVIASSYYGAVAGASIFAEKFDNEQKRQRLCKTQVEYFLPQIVEASKPTTYRVSIRTGDIKYAGTDADVYIKLSGDYASTPYHRINLDCISLFCSSCVAERT